MRSRSKYRSLAVVGAAISLVAVLTAPHSPAGAQEGPEADPPAAVDPAPTPNAANAAAVNYWIHQFNVCSLVCQTKIGPNRNNALDLVAWYEAVDSPWYISLNEICQSEIKALVTATGMSAAWILTKRYDERCPGETTADDRFGNAVLFRYPAPANGSAWWFQEQKPQTPPCAPAPAADGSNECRGMLCIKTNTPAGLEAGCSSHLDPNVDIAYDQSAEYAWNGAVFHPGSSYLAGDFNLWPASEIHGAFSANCAVDSGSHYLTYDAVEGMTAKIDYIWLCPGGGAVVAPIRQPYCEPTYSDHCYLFWNLTFA